MSVMNATAPGVPTPLGGSGMSLRHTPWRVRRSSRTRPRTAAITSPKAWSATHWSLVPAPLLTAMPWARA